MTQDFLQVGCHSCHPTNNVKASSLLHTVMHTRTKVNRRRTIAADCSRPLPTVPSSAEAQLGSHFHLLGLQTPGGHGAKCVPLSLRTPVYPKRQRPGG